MMARRVTRVVGDGSQRAAARVVISALTVLASWVFGLAANAQGVAFTSDPQPTTFATIEVGAKYVRASMVSLTLDALDAVQNPEGGRPALRYEVAQQLRVRSLPEVVTNGSFAENAEATADVVREFRDYFVESEDVPINQMFLVMESGLGRMAHAGALAEAVSRRSGLQPVFISPEDEGAHLFDWAAPAYRRSEAVIVDVGGTNITAGYQRGDGAATGVELSAYGVTTALKSLVDANDGVPPAEFDRALRTWLRRNLDPMLYRAGLSHPALVNRPRVYMSGDVVGVMVAITKPETALDDWVPLTARDIRDFEERVRGGDPFAVDVSGIADDEIRARAEAELQYAQDIFTRDQLRTGVAMMRALANRLELERRERIFFSRVSRRGWQTEHLLERADAAARTVAAASTLELDR